MRREFSLQAGVVERKGREQEGQARGGLKFLEDCCCVAAARGVW